jgi:hypothetical protein
VKLQHVHRQSIIPTGGRLVAAVELRRDGR